MSDTTFPTLTNLRIPMRDGVHLAANVTLPAGPGPFPVAVLRTPYGGTAAPNPKGAECTKRGYAMLVQDCRGRYASEGEFYPWHPEAGDGEDTLDWVRQQPWCNGATAMIGGSYCGLVQWLAAARRPRGLTCLVPRVCTANFYDSPNYAGGAFQLALNILWGFNMTGRERQPNDRGDWAELLRTLPLLTADRAAGLDLRFWRDWVRHPRFDRYWQEVCVEDQFDRVQTPALIMGGWYDLYAKQSLANFRDLRAHGGSRAAREHTRVIMGPWPHALAASTRTGDLDFGPGAIVDLEAIEYDFLDTWLGKRQPPRPAAPVRLFIMGINRWRDEYEWPLARTRWTPFYLHSNGAANSLQGDGALSAAAPKAEPPDHFVYDPENPVPTLGGNTCCRADLVPSGPLDQRPVEARPDVLVYTSAPLAEDMEVTGPITVRLYAASSARDTDFTAKLVDVHPDGTAMNLCDGIIRGRYRRSFRRAAFLKPETVYEFAIDCWVTSNVFRRGHRVRLDISSSNFPRFDRNPNTGHPFGMDAELRRATQTVHHSGCYPSHVILPVIPA